MKWQHLLAQCGTATMFYKAMKRRGKKRSMGEAQNLKGHVGKFQSLKSASDLETLAGPT